MNTDASPTSKDTGFLRHAAASSQQQTGQSLVLWAFIALLSFLTQIVFRRELAPGEFGTLNTVLGVIGLMTVPLLALPQAFTWYLARNHPPGQRERLDTLRSSSLLITETWAWAWGGLSFLILFPLLSLLGLPRFSLDLFALLNVLLALAGVLGGAISLDKGQMRFWFGLLVTAAVARVLVGAVLAGYEPWAESGLTAYIFAGLIPLTPVMRRPMIEIGVRLQALRAVLDRDFFLYLGATFSVLLGIFLFSSADRIVAQSWFGSPSKDNAGFVKDYVDWPVFDAYQTAGLLARALLWGTQPLLFVMFAQRSALERTTKATLTWFWIYLGALIVGVILLIMLGRPLSWLFCGADFFLTSRMVPVFALAMLPLGLLQGLGFFALASRRFHECFVFGGCGVGYALLLYLVGRQAQLMPAYMFGGGMTVIMIVLFVGVVRWGRKQP